MEIIPSVDIARGRCVKRVRGVEGTGLDLGDPVEQALRWEGEGARRLHVVDLDGASEGRPVNDGVIREILRRTSIPVQVGGGVRGLEHAAGYLEAGARWIILGTAVVEEPELLEMIVDALGGERVIAALDYDERGRIVARGWRIRTGRSLLEEALRLDGLGLAAFLCTYTPLEGTMRGVDAETMRRLTELVETPVIYAGGIRSIQDLILLRDAGVYGAVLGMALYRGEISLREAMRVCGVGGGARG